MEINMENRDGITVAKIVGSLDSATSAQAQEKLMPLGATKCYLALDLSNCDYISSAGLRVLLMLAKELNVRGGRLALVGVTEEVKDVMDITGFINFFRLYSTVEETIDEMRKES